MIRIGVLSLLGLAIVLTGVGCKRESGGPRNDMPIKASPQESGPGGKKQKSMEAGIEDTTPPKR